MGKATATAGRDLPQGCRLAVLVVVAILAAPLSACLGRFGPLGPPVGDAIEPPPEVLVPGVGYHSFHLNLSNGTNGPVAADLSPDRERLAFAMLDGTLQIWGSNGSFQNAFQANGTNCTQGFGAVRFLDGVSVAVSCWDTIRTYEINGVLLWERQFTTWAYIEDFAVAREGAVVAVRYPQPLVEVWDRTLDRVLSVDVEDGTFRRLALSEDGTTLAAAGRLARFFRIDVATNTSALLESVPRNTNARISADGRWGVVGRDPYGSPRDDAAVFVDLAHPGSPAVTAGRNTTGERTISSQSDFFASRSGRFGAWIDALGVRNPNGTAPGESFFSVVLVVDRDRPAGHAGFQAGGDFPPAETPQGESVLNLFLADDGGALSLLVRQGDPASGLATVATVTVAEPGATPPTKRDG